MTHGDKAKAKAGKSSQAPAKKVSSKTVEAQKGSGKAVAKAESKAPGKSGKTVVKAQPAGRQGASPAQKGGGTGAKEADTDAKKSRGGPAESAGFSNAVVAAAFKRALKKYPNALRKLTD